MTPEEVALLQVIQELRDEGRGDEVEELLASLDAPAGPSLVVDGGITADHLTPAAGIDRLWTDVVRSSKITTDMLINGQREDH